MMIHHTLFVLLYFSIFLYSIKLVARMRRKEDKGYLEALVVTILVMSPLNMVSNIYDLLYSRMPSNGADFYVNLKIGQEWFTALVSIMVLQTVKKIRRDTNTRQAKPV